MQIASPNRPLTIVDIVLKQKSDQMTSREEEGVKRCAPLPARNGTCARAPLVGRTINCRLRRHEVVHKGRDWDARSVSRNCLTSRVCETDACHGVHCGRPHLYGLAELVSRFSTHPSVGDSRWPQHPCSIVDRVRGAMRSPKYSCKIAAKLSVKTASEIQLGAASVPRQPCAAHTQRASRLVRQKTL